MTNRKLHNNALSIGTTGNDLELENNVFSSFRRQYPENSMHCCLALTFSSYLKIYDVIKYALCDRLSVFYHS